MSDWMEEIEERESKATEGPWEHDPNGFVIAGVNTVVADIMHDGARNGPFIAHARTDIKRLVKALRMLIDTVEYHRTILVEMDEWVCDCYQYNDHDAMGAPHVLCPTCAFDEVLAAIEAGDIDG